MAMAVPTSATRIEFHTNVVKLLEKTNEPCEPVNYLGREYVSREDYVLLHEEEQHLADGIAFLARAKEGPKYISAVTLEQSISPASLIIRLSSNTTPSNENFEGLRRVLDTVAEYARAGEGRKLFHARIFEHIVALSKDRLLTRIRPSHSKTTRFRQNPNKISLMHLHEKIDGLLESISLQNLDGKDGSLSTHLSLLKQSLKDAEANLSGDVIGALKVVVQRSCEVCNLNGAKSLESQLRELGATKDLYESRLVVDIDKISKYLNICKELMRFSRREKSRPVFSNIRLEVCTAPPVSRPPGSRMECCVHAEVQLVLHYERYPAVFPPRCIGSSKSACFLCDLFIAKHRKFHISHTHKRLYEKWTVPEASWMSPQQKTKLEKILKAMNTELVRLLALDKPKRLYDNGPESRVHLLILPEGATISSPLTSVLSHVQTNPSLSKTISTTKPKASTSTLTLNTITPNGTPAITVYNLNHLPLLLKINAFTKSSTLLVEKLAYIFDLEDIQSGQLQISEYVYGVGERCLRVNARDPVLDSILALRDGLDEHVLRFCVHDDDRHELQIVVRWTD